MRSEMEITLVPLREDLLTDFLDLQVRSEQTAFVEPPAESLEDRNARAWDTDWNLVCIFSAQTMVGYAMHGMSGDGDVWLDRFMIDRRYQGRGLGHAAFQQLLEQVRRVYPDRKRILLSVEKHNAFAIRMYRNFGFQMTPLMDGIYPVMMLSE